MQRVLITGATGDLGFALAESLSGDGQFQIETLLRSTSDTKKLEKLNLKIYTEFKQIPAGLFAVIDCVTNYGRNQEDPKQVFAVNFTRALQLLQDCKSASVEKIIFTDTKLPPELGAYAESKMQLRNELKKTSGNICVANFRLEHFYGRKEKPHKFLAWFMNQLIENHSPISLTSCEQLRNFVYIDDIISAVETTLLAPLSPGYHEFDLGSEEVWPLKKILIYLQNRMDKNQLKLDFGAIPLRPHEVMKSEVDLSALKQLGWQPKIGLQQGLDLLVQTYLGKSI